MQFGNKPAWGTYTKCLFAPQPARKTPFMKLYLFFVLFDLIVLLMYPIAYVIHRLRQMKGVK